MASEVKQAVIMVGGKGTRLHPLTNTRPKPVMPILDIPCLKYLIKSIASAGIDDIILACGYKSSVLADAIGDGSDMGVSIEYSDEDTPLGTGGAIKMLEDRLDPVFVAANGDTFVDIDLKGEIDTHFEKGADITISLTHVDKPTEYGIVRVDDDGRITQFKEKPKPEEVFSDLINAGVYVIDRDVLRHVPEDTFFDLSKDLFPIIMEEGGRLQGYELEGVWKDVGRPSDLIYTNLLMADRLYKDKDWDISESGNVVEGPFYLGKGALVKNSEFHSSVVMGGCTVKDSSLSGTVLMGHCTVNGAIVEDSILGEGCTIGRGAHVIGCVLGDGTSVESGRFLERVVRNEG